MTISNIAKQLYKRSDEEKLLRGKPLEAVISTCIFIACRQAMCLECCNVVHVSKRDAWPVLQDTRTGFESISLRVLLHSIPTIAARGLAQRSCLCGTAAISTCLPTCDVLAVIFDNTALQTGGVQYLLQEGPSTSLVIYWAYKN